MPSVVPIQQNVQRYMVVAPEGDQIEIPKELFKALWDFSQGSKATGSVVIHFRNGGVAGLEAVIKRTYKKLNRASSFPVTGEGAAAIRQE